MSGFHVDTASSVSILMKEVVSPSLKNRWQGSHSVSRPVKGEGKDSRRKCKQGGVEEWWTCRVEGGQWMREGKGQEEGEKATEKEGGESRKRVIDRMKGGGYS